jgi:tetratricopeptide (TPR) repeat protein
MNALRSLPASSLLVLLMVAPAPAQDSRPGGPPPTSPQGIPQGSSRESMWYPPTAEDWQKPVLITFQRTFDDALRVSEETGKPILVCVNMDGEIASEHYAGVRYRDPEKARLYEPYVCVIASVYRHNPRDHDDEGRRILCPRFGSVTCGEHIWIEPIVYEKFLDGRRIAPRHIMVEQGKQEVFDIYYAFDTDSVFRTIQEHAREVPPVPQTDLAIPERVASADVKDRIAVETAYAKGTAGERRTILQSVLSHSEIDHVDVLRLALFGLDLDLARIARQALAQSSSESAIDLIVEVLRTPLEAGERELLVAALDRLGREFPRAATLAAVHQGLSARSTEVDSAGWSTALTGAEYPAPTEWETLTQRVESQQRRLSAAPQDPATQVELAEAALSLAVDPKTAQVLSQDTRTRSDYSALQFEDARTAALEAERLGAKGWRVEAVLALSSWYLGDRDEAWRRAEIAVRELPTGEPSWNAMGVLALFAQSRQRAILRAVREQTEWPRQWMADVHDTYDVLATHPFGADYHVVAHYDFLRRLGATAEAWRVIDRGLQRFPQSWMLHDRLRGRVLEEKGVAGLEEVYARLLEREDAGPEIEWYAGYAGLVAAEYHRRGGDRPQAEQAYTAAIAHFENAILSSPGSRDSSDHYVAMALAGKARCAFEGGDLERATRTLLAAFARKPEAASSLDGLNLSAIDTANVLRARLLADGRQDLANELREGIDALDPRHLLLPAYEQDLPGDPSNARRANRGRRQQDQ